MMDIIADEENSSLNRPSNTHYSTGKAESAERELTLKFGSEVICISCTKSEDIGSVKGRLAEHAGFELSSIKLVVKGKILRDDAVVQELWAGGAQVRVALIGSKSADLLPIVPHAQLARVKDDLSDQVKAAKRVKLKTSSGGFNLNSPHKFGRIEALPGFSDTYVAQQMLEELASDPAILHVLSKHKWSVGALCEMFPEGYVGVSDVCVMGLNQNHGEKILLRLRTDDLKGFRKALSIRKVLYHELAHNVYSDHDDDFYMLMRQIEREVNEADWTTNGRGRVLDNGYQRYQGPPTSSAANVARESHVYRLGGDEELKQSLRPAELAALAAERRLSPEEEEVEGGCGCTGQVQTLHASRKTTVDSLHVVEESGEMAVCGEDRNCVPTEQTEGSSKVEEPPSDYSTHTTRDRTPSPPADMNIDKTQINISTAEATPPASPVEPSNILSPKALSDLCSQFLMCSNSVINNAVSFDQAHILPALEQLRDAIITFLSKYNKGGIDYVMSGEQCAEVSETMQLIKLIAGNAKVNCFNVILYSMLIDVIKFQDINEMKYRRLKKSGSKFNRYCNEIVACYFEALTLFSAESLFPGVLFRS